MNVSPLRLSIVVPTFNESQNVQELLCRLEATLGATGWEVIFVDDDSPDGTAIEVRAIARIDSRIRCLQAEAVAGQGRKPVELAIHRQIVNSDAVALHVAHVAQAV